MDNSFHIIMCDTRDTPCYLRQGQVNVFKLIEAYGQQSFMQIIVYILLFLGDLQKPSGSLIMLNLTGLY